MTHTFSLTGNFKIDVPVQLEEAFLLGIVLALIGIQLLDNFVMIGQFQWRYDSLHTQIFQMLVMARSDSIWVSNLDLGLFNGSGSYLTKFSPLRNITAKFRAQAITGKNFEVIHSLFRLIVHCKILRLSSDRSLTFTKDSFLIIGFY